ncbi:MAG TPA: DUF3710 domain-containing protein [Streptosporangiaceae bacterium]
MFGRRRREDAGDRPGRGRGTGRDEQELAGPGDEPELDENPDFDDELAAADDPDWAGEDQDEQLGRAAARRGEDLGDPSTWTRLRDNRAGAVLQADDGSGPWDSAASYPECERLDFGSLLVPVREGFDIQVNLDEEAGIWVAVVAGDSGLQLQAFAAPKTSGLWDEVRRELEQTVADSGGQAAAADGPFGPEVKAVVSQPGEDGRPQPPQALRFLGADGPRWFLRGMISGPAASRPELAQPFEEIFGDVVVVRGEHPEPPRKALDIQLPEEARQAIEEQFAAAEGMPTDAQGMPVNPFERGPEITEIH